VIDLHVQDGACAASLGVPITPETVTQVARVQQLVQQQRLVR